jgi:hypothetical protein
MDKPDAPLHLRGAGTIFPTTREGPEMCITVENPEGGEEVSVVLKDMDEWDEFVAANREAVESEYPSVEVALKHARDGGLTLGGGAAPLFLITFEM